MPNSWITKSDGAEIRLAHPYNRAGMADSEREDGRGANRKLVSRSTIVEDCVWDGTVYAFTMRRAK